MIISFSNKYSWELFFSTNSPSITTTTRVSLTVENSFYFKNCLFNNLSSSSHGGAFYVSSSSDDSKVLIEDTTFSECTSYYNGGGIYFYNKGQIVLYKICGNKCKTSSTTYSGQISLTVTSLASSSIIPHHYIILSSTINCGSYTTMDYSQIKSEGKYNTIRCDCGNQLIDTVNASNNNCYRMSFIGLYGSSNENSYVTNQIKYCTSSNNKDTDGINIITYSSRKYTLSNCNIINNEIDPSY